MTRNNNECKVLTCLIGLGLISMAIIDYRVMICSVFLAFLALLSTRFNGGKIVSGIHEFVHSAHMMIKEKNTSRLNEFLMALAFLWVIICLVVYIYIVICFIV